MKNCYHPCNPCDRRPWPTHEPRLASRRTTGQAWAGHVHPLITPLGPLGLLRHEEEWGWRRRICSHTFIQTPLERVEDESVTIFVDDAQPRPQAQAGTS